MDYRNDFEFEINGFNEWLIFTVYTYTWIINEKPKLMLDPLAPLMSYVSSHPEEFCEAPDEKDPCVENGKIARTAPKSKERPIKPSRVQHSPTSTFSTTVSITSSSASSSSSAMAIQK
ncbi:unnamed protein product [Caenorhabditis bovis]|uniref:Uncharacterized protein n=1 Tax=Caenorhabditis bovis TaxID=2654633 RepID=A0A8S1EYU0_9PELO|nr:unnamed protein product [Caenorhabditis bovis]